MNALEFRVNYVKVAEGRPVASATKMWPNKSSFWQHMTDAKLKEITENDVLTRGSPLSKAIR